MISFFLFWNLITLVQNTRAIKIETYKHESRCKNSIKSIQVRQIMTITLEIQFFLLRVRFPLQVTTFLWYSFVFGEILFIVCLFDWGFATGAWSLMLAITVTHCNALQLTATHCTALQRTVTHYNTLQYTTTHCNAWQHTATHCNTITVADARHHGNKHQNTATRCSKLQHTATHCNTITIADTCHYGNEHQHTATRCNTLQHTATHCNTLTVADARHHGNEHQRTATHCNALQHTAIHCNTLQHTATQSQSLTLAITSHAYSVTPPRFRVYSNHDRRTFGQRCPF